MDEQVPPADIACAVDTEAASGSQLQKYAQVPRVTFNIPADIGTVMTESEDVELSEVP